MNEGTLEKLPYLSKFVDVQGCKIHYLEQGTGNPILFLHGIPASCYTWRNVIPWLAGLGLCIAPDLPGFGHSGKPDIEYTVFDHIKYINQFIEALNLEKITLVMHGWGCVIGLDYALHNEKNCNGLVLYEPFLLPLDGDSVSLPFQEQLRELDNLSLEKMKGPGLIEKIIPQQTLRQLTEVEMDCYRQPFLKGNIKPILQYLRELPRVDGKKTKIHALIAEQSVKLAQSRLPKLLLYSVPGFITTISSVIWAKENLSNIEVAEIGEELHFAQESNPHLMGETISAWLQGVGGSF